MDGDRGTMTLTLNSLSEGLAPTYNVLEHSCSSRGVPMPRRGPHPDMGHGMLAIGTVPQSFSKPKQKDLL